MSTTQYIPRIPLLNIVVFVAILVKKFWRDDLSEERKRDLFRILFRILEGNNCDSNRPFVFPFAGSSDPTIANHPFLAATLLPHLSHQCPALMEPVMAQLQRYPDHSRSEFAAEAVSSGYILGDGSIFCKLDGTESPVISYAIKDSEEHRRSGTDPNAWKYFLHKNMPGMQSMNPKGITRAMNRQTFGRSLFFLAATLCLVFKAPQFYAMCILAGPLQFMTSFMTSFGTVFVRIIRKMFARLCSGLNMAHGVGLGSPFYDYLLRVMTECRLPLVLNYHMGGMLGSDGCIQCDEIRLCQSNRFYLESLARKLEEHFGFQRPSVGHNGGDSASVNSRAKYAMRIRRDEDRVLATAYFGVFDYNRRVQWLVQLIAIIISNTNLQNKKAIEDFLKEFMSYVKGVRES